MRGIDTMLILITVVPRVYMNKMVESQPAVWETQVQLPMDLYSLVCLI